MGAEWARGGGGQVTDMWQVAQEGGRSAGPVRSCIPAGSKACGYGILPLVGIHTSSHGRQTGGKDLLQDACCGLEDVLVIGEKMMAVFGQQAEGELPMRAGRQQHVVHPARAEGLVGAGSAHVHVCWV